MLPYYLKDLVKAWEPVGSRVTCNPAPTDTDQDILVLADVEEYHVMKDELLANKWEYSDGRGPMPKEPEFNPSDQASIDAWGAWKKEYKKWQSEEGYEDIGSYAGKETSFNSWRLGELNLIVTMKQEWYDTFLLATASCKEKNLLLKSERLAEFEKFFPKTEKPKQKRKAKIKGKTATQMLIDDIMNDTPTYQAQAQTVGLSQGAQNTQPVHWSYLAQSTASIPMTAYTMGWNTSNSIFGTGG